MKTYRDVEIPAGLTLEVLEALSTAVSRNVYGGFTCLTIEELWDRSAWVEFLEELGIDVSGTGFSGTDTDHYVPEWVLELGDTPKQRRLAFIQEIQDALRV